MSTNPYADLSHQLPPPGMVVPGGRRRPGALTAVAVLSLVLGIMGLLSSCLALVVLPFQSQFQNAVAGMAPGPGASPIEKQQYEMQVAIAAANQQYVVPQMIASAAHVVFATCMIIGSILVLRWREKGRVLLIYTLLAVIVFELLRTALGVFVQLQILPVYDEFANRMSRELTGTTSDQTIVWITRMTKGFMIAGIVMSVAWPLAKIILYGLSARYLSSDTVRALFEKSPKDAAAPTL